MSTNICFVRRGYSASGGAEAYLKRLASVLAGKGMTPALITTRDWPVEAWPFGAMIQVRANSPEKFAREAISHFSDTHMIFSLERVPGCHIFRAGDGVHASWLKRREMFEPVWKKWLHRINPKHRQLLALEREVFQSDRTRRIIVNSRMVQDEIRKQFSYPNEKIRLVYNGYTPPKHNEMTRSQARLQLQLPPDDVVGLFVGSGWKRKGLELALELPRRIARCQLLVAGQGKTDTNRENVRFLGAIQDLTPYFSAADFFVLPTYYDPFSNACLEALAAGLPTFTTSANGFAEIIEPGLHGEIISPGDKDGLIQSVRIWAEQGRFERQRESCKQRALKFSIEQNVEETLKVINEVML